MKFNARVSTTAVGFTVIMLTVFICKCAIGALSADKLLDLLFYFPIATIIAHHIGFHTLRVIATAQIAFLRHIESKQKK